MGVGSTTGRLMVSLILFFILLARECSLAKKRTPQENLEAMLSLQEEHGGVILVDDALFNKHVKSKHSKYSVVAMFTALGAKYNCEACPDAKDEFSLLASSYASMKSSTNIFFVMVDYSEAPEAFISMGLSHAPEFLFFPGNRKRKKISDKLDTMRVGYESVALSKWISEIEDIKIEIKRPINYKKLIAPGIIVLFVLVAGAINPGFLYRVACSKTLWGAAILFLVLAMTSGQMWNFIRNPMDSGHNMRGEVELIMASDHGQFRYESYLIIALNGVISFGFILMNQAKEIKHWLIRRIVGLLGLCMVVIFFGLLISIFRMKNHGYPYLLLFT